MFSQEKLNSIARNKNLEYEIKYSSKDQVWELSLYDQTSEPQVFKAKTLAQSIQAACGKLLDTTIYNNIPNGLNPTQARILAVASKDVHLYSMALATAEDSPPKTGLLGLLKLGLANTKSFKATFSSEKRMELLNELLVNQADPTLFTTLFTSPIFQGVPFHQTLHKQVPEPTSKRQKAILQTDPWSVVYSANLPKNLKDNILAAMLPFYTFEKVQEVSGQTIQCTHLTAQQIMNAAKYDCSETVSKLLEHGYIGSEFPSKNNNSVMHGSTVYTECAKLGAQNSCKLIKEAIPSLDYNLLNEDAIYGNVEKITLRGVDYLSSEGMPVLEIFSKRLDHRNNTAKANRLFNRIINHIINPQVTQIEELDIVSDIELA